MARVLLYTLACNGKQGIEQRGERTDYYEGTEKLKSTFRLKVNDG